MSRYDHLKPLEYFVIERCPSMGYEPDGVIAGPFLSFYEAEQYRSKYFGHDNINYYSREENE